MTCTEALYLRKYLHAEYVKLRLGKATNACGREWRRLLCFRMCVSMNFLVGALVWSDDTVRLPRVPEYLACRAGCSVLDLEKANLHQPQNLWLSLLQGSAQWR